MKFKTIFPTVLLIITTLFLTSCDTSESKDLEKDTTSMIQLKLVDAPDDNYDQVWVEIIDVRYNKNNDEAGWTSFDGYPNEGDGDMVDLTELIAGSSHILTDQEIESGMLSQVRLVLGENNYLIIEGSEEHIPLKTPSAQQSGLKLKLNTELVAGYSYTFTLDWDVQKSIVKAGNSGNYNLKPTIRVIAEANSGIIEGRVADIEETTENPIPLKAIIEVYNLSNEYITSTNSNEEGLFMASGISEGVYTLKVLSEGYSDTTSESLSVNKEESTSVGDILLTKSP